MGSTYQGPTIRHWCQLILLFLKKGTIPDDEKSEKFLKSYAQKSIINKDVLYMTVPDKQGQLRSCLWVPKMYQKMLLEAAHCHPFSGHEGIDKTLAKLQNKYWWPGQIDQV